MGSVSQQPMVSVLTPTTARADRAGFLLELYGDLLSTTVAWEWIVTVDGSHGRGVPDVMRQDRRVRVLRIGRQAGAAAARNLGLGVARGRYITCVDDDDRLPAGSLARRVDAAFAAQVPWVAGLLADDVGGSTQVWQCPVPRGRVEAGDVWRLWGCPCMAFPLGPTTLLTEAQLLREVGGWQGLPQAEDFGMALAVTGRAPGVMLGDVVYVYRKHAGQMLAQKDFPTLEPLVRHITFERGRLLAQESVSPAA